MYCDGCGTQLTSGGQFCTKCGKPIMPSAGASSPGSGHPGVPPAAAAASDGRVRRNIHRLAILWMISGILRLMGIGWMMIFGRLFIPPMRGWMGPGGGPFFGWSLDSVLSRGIFSAGGNFFRWSCAGDFRSAAPGSGVGAFRTRAVGAIPRASPGIPGAAAFSAGHRAGDLHAVGAAAGDFRQRVRPVGSTRRASPLRVGFFLSLFPVSAPRVPRL